MEVESGELELVSFELSLFKKSKIISTVVSVPFFSVCKCRKAHCYSRISDPIPEILYIFKLKIILKQNFIYFILV